MQELAKVMPAAVQGSDGATPPMIVDPVNHLGFAMGNDDGATKLVMYDLEKLELIDAIDVTGASPEDIYAFVVDPEQELLIDAGPFLSVGNPLNLVCRAEAGFALSTFHYGHDPAGTRSFETDFIQTPCAGAYGFVATSGSIYEGASGGRKLLLTGTYTSDGARSADPSLGLADNDGAPLLIRQLDLDKVYGPDWQQSLEWEIDLRYAGCGRRGVSFARQAARSILTYCSDTRPGPFRLVSGDQGYVVRIPLDDDDRPLTDDTPAPLAGMTNPADPDGDPLVDDRLPPIPNPTNPLRQPDRTQATDPEYLDDYTNNPTYDEFIANPVIRRTPALPGEIFPFVDASSGAVLLLTADPSNGNAVWVFDPDAERFVGLMTGGVVSSDEHLRTAAGFDPVRGRAYLLTSSGLLMAPIRQRPLPPGAVHPVVTAHRDEHGNVITNDRTVAYQDLAIDPKLERVFVPVTGEGYVVVEDRIPDPPQPATFDPDTLTTQVDEEDGVTEVNSVGAAIATGFNMINVGGVPRVVNQVDPLCHNPHEALDPIHDNINESDLFGGSCASDQVVTRGNRSTQLASSQVSAALESDASAESSGLRIPERDQATHNDIRELGDCGYGYMERFQRPFTWMSEQDDDPDNDHSPQSPRGQDGGFCDQLQRGLHQVTGDDLRNGTRGGEYPEDTDGDGIPDTSPEPGEGFPIRAASCNDFGSDPSSDSLGESERDSGKDIIASSAVQCDASVAGASARASAHGLAYPDADAPVISIGHTWTDTTTSKTLKGQVTTATAIVEGVRVGPLMIGELRSVAATQARGRSGTATVEHSRTWCRISIDGLADFLPDADEENSMDVPPSHVNDGVVTDGCVDPDEDKQTRELLDELNQALGRIRFSVPPASTEATDGGYQAVATKDPNVRAADQAVNDDDSHTVPALQAVIYNDGPEGRSRVIAQFAGVHTEARYGIVLLPDFDVPEFPDVDLPAITTDPFVPPTVAGTRARTIEDPVRIITIGNEPPDNPLAQFFNAPAQVLQQFLSWLINNPLEAALLFMLLSLLASPIYLTLRARAAARALEP